MTLLFRSVLLVAALLSCIYALIKIRRSQMKIEDAIYWFFIMGVLILLSVFPGIAVFMSEILGIESPTNLVFLFMIFLLFVKALSLSVKVAVLQQKFNLLVQEVAISRNENNKLSNIIDIPDSNSTD